MRGVLTGLAIFLASGAAAGGESIEGAIRGQVDAFLADDFGTAFTFAGPGIQSMFGTSERFGEMVRGGYPMVHRPRSVRMGDLREEAGVPWQRVYVTDADGRMHALDYRMGQYPDGWRIDGVVFVPMPDVGV